MAGITVIPLQSTPQKPRWRRNRCATHALAFMEATFPNEPWGWKDPRNAITAPVWQEWMPELRFVICLRNPLDAAQSMVDRDKWTYLEGFESWYVYNERLLSGIPREHRIVTHYDTYFSEGAHEAEVARVAGFLGMTVSEEQIKTACSACNPALRHSFASLQDLYDAEPPPAVAAMYESMLEEAGPWLPEKSRSRQRASPHGRTVAALMRAESRERKCETQRRAREEENRLLTIRILALEEEMQVIRSALRKAEVDAAHWEVHAGQLHRKLEWWPHRLVEGMARRAG